MDSVQMQGEGMAERDAMRMILSGSLWALGGAAFTMAAHATGASGGAYVMAWGAALFGVVDLARGISLRRRADG